MIEKLLTVLAAAMLTAAVNIATAGAAENSTRTALYIFAHEDDEIDVAAKMAVDMRAGTSVFSVWVTNGDKAGDPAVREKESRNVMKLIGIPHDHLFFLDYPDQEAHRHIGPIIRNLTDIALKIGAAEIMSHAYEGGNIDHDTVSFVSAVVAKKLGVTHFEFPDNSVYGGETIFWEFLPEPALHVLYTRLDRELYNLKMKTLGMYPSQASGLNMYNLLIDKNHLKKYGEPYRVAPEYDYTKPPAEELRYDSTSKGTATIDMFLSAVNEYLESGGVK